MPRKKLDPDKPLALGLVRAPRQRRVKGTGESRDIVREQRKEHREAAKVVKAITNAEHDQHQREALGVWAPKLAYLAQRVLDSVDDPKISEMNQIENAKYILDRELTAQNIIDAKALKQPPQETSGLDALLIALKVKDLPDKQ